MGHESCAYVMEEGPLVALTIGAFTPRKSDDDRSRRPVVSPEAKLARDSASIEGISASEASFKKPTEGMDAGISSKPVHTNNRS